MSVWSVTCFEVMHRFDAGASWQVAAATTNAFLCEISAENSLDSCDSPLQFHRPFPAHHIKCCCQRWHSYSFSQEDKICWVFFFFHLLLCRIQIKELDLHFNRKWIWYNLNYSLKRFAHHRLLVSFVHFKIIHRAYITSKLFVSHPVHQHTWHVPLYAMWCTPVANFCDHVTTFLCDLEKILPILKPCLCLNTHESDIQVQVAGGKKAIMKTFLHN